MRKSVSPPLQKDFLEKFENDWCVRVEHCITWRRKRRCLPSFSKSSAGAVKRKNPECRKRKQRKFCEVDYFPEQSLRFPLRLSLSRNRWKSVQTDTNSGLTIVLSLIKLFVRSAVRKWRNFLAIPSCKTFISFFNFHYLRSFHIKHITQAFYSLDVRRCGSG